MALRDQPYIPFYVDDYLTDEKLNNCSAATQGVYIKIICVLHKQEEYGCMVLFKQKDKQNQSMTLNFTYKFAKHLPFDLDTIHSAIEELVDEGVLIIDGDKLYQKRMVKDNAISLARSKAGKKGGGNPVLLKQKDKQEFKQKDKQNPVNVIEDVNEYLLLDYDTIYSILYKEEIWIENICMNYKINKNQVIGFLKQFVADQKVSKPGKRTLVEFRNHFNNVMRKKSEAGVFNVTPGKKEIDIEAMEQERQQRKANWRHPDEH